METIGTCVLLNGGGNQNIKKKILFSILWVLNVIILKFTHVYKVSHKSKVVKLLTRGAAVVLVGKVTPRSRSDWLRTTSEHHCPPAQQKQTNSPPRTCIPSQHYISTPITDATPHHHPAAGTSSPSSLYRRLAVIYAQHQDPRGRTGLATSCLLLHN